MMSLSDRTGLPTILLVLLLSGLQAACDGGLFGTDDGGVLDAPLATAPPDTLTPPSSLPGQETADTADGADAGDDTGSPISSDAGATGEAGDTINLPSESESESESEDPAAPAGGETTGSIELFTNTRITTPRNDALLTVVNPRGTDLQLLVESLGEAVATDLTVAPESASRHLALPVGSSIVQLSADASDTNTMQARLELNLGAGTLTTLIARDRADDQLDIVPLASESGSSDSTLARVRVLQATGLDDPERSATLQLASRGPDGGGIEAGFADISFSRPDSGYQEVPAGDYTLSDSAGRFPPQAVSFAGGQAYTLILRAADGRVLQLEVDSDLDLP